MFFPCPSTVKIMVEMSLTHVNAAGVTGVVMRDQRSVGLGGIAVDLTQHEGIYIGIRS